MTAAREAVPEQVQQVLDVLDGVTGAYPQWSARCLAHDDHRPSLRVGIGGDGLATVWCQAHGDDGCDWSALRAALLSRQVPESALRGGAAAPLASRGSTPQRPTQMSRRAEARPLAAVPDEGSVERYVWAIREEQLHEVSEWRGIDEAVLIQADLGYDAHRKRYALPIRGLRTGELLDVRYCPASGDDRKWRHRSGGKSRLFAPLGLRNDLRVVICEGEWDAMVAAEHGFNAVATTGGAGTPPTTDQLEALRGREVVIVFDCDESGRTGAAKFAAALAALGCRVSIAELALGEKEDVSDFFVKYRKSSADFAAVLDGAEPWAEGDHAEEEAAGVQPVDWDEFWSSEPQPIRYLVEPVIAEGEITRVYAQAKVGKSLLVLECAAGLATGRGALGDVTGEQVPVVYVDQENTPDDWKTRLSDMGYGPEDDWSALRWFSLQSWPPLDTAAGGAALLWAVQDHGARLVVLDTQSKFLEGEEDKAPTGAAFYRHTLLPLKRAGVAVVVIDHAGKDGGSPRGSSTKQDDVDTIWRVEKVGRERVRLLRTHGRKRHSVDTLTLARQPDPLRHVPVGLNQSTNVTATPTVSETETPAVRDTIAALYRLDLDPKTSQRTALKLLRESGFTFRNQDGRAAWKAIQAEAGLDA